MTRRIGLSLLLLTIALTGTSCPGPKDGNPPDDGSDNQQNTALRRFKSADELRSYFAGQALARYTPSGGWGGQLFTTGGFAPMSAEDASAAAAPASNGSASGESAGTPSSTTNIQEEGVDESDVVKNDGQYIYLIQDNVLHVVQAVPANAPAELATLSLEAGYGKSLYLRGDKLIAVGVVYPPYDPNVGYRPSQAGVTIINVSNPAAPAVEAVLHFEGYLASSRLIENRLYLVLATTPRLPTVSSVSPTPVQQLISNVTTLVGNITPWTADDPVPQAINAMPLEDWIPNYEIVAADGSVVASGDIAGWEDFYRPNDPDGYGICMVVTVDVDNPTSPFAKAAISADAGTIYASTQALYITDTNYSYANGASRTETLVHKIKFVPEGTVYAGSGQVAGRPLNQYSMGEHEDYLRIATTSQQYGDTGITWLNNLYVLGEASDGTLPVVGKIEGIAPGERIYSARFLGNRGFLVTFVQVDPLFTLDLTDPANPKIVGQLKVPGYSDHIQLLDENHLLTIGKDAQTAGSATWFGGVQLSIFDVTDAANPALLYKTIIGGRGTSSEANSNPKAFTYFSARNALAFPIDLYTDNGRPAPAWGRHEFTGLYVYRVTVQNGFELLGRIQSDGGFNSSNCFLPYTGFTRGVFIGDTVYSVTGRNVKSAALDAVGTVLGKVDLSGASALTPECPSVIRTGD